MKRLEIRCISVVFIIFLSILKAGVLCQENVEAVVFPENPVIYNNERLSVTMFQKTNSCELLSDIDEKSYKITAGDTCAVTFDNIENNLNGRTFALKGTDENNVEYVSKNVTLQVFDKSNIIQNFSNTIKLGEKFDLDVSQPNAVRCKFISPDNTIAEFSSSCIHSLNPAARNDNGTWKVVTIFKGITEEITISYTVIIKETFIGSWNKKGNKINLLCDVGHPINYCAFSSPHRDTYSLAEGTGTSKYYYYGNGFQSGSCGMTIENASFIDNGIWKCIWGEDNMRYLDVNIRKNSGNYSELISSTKFKMAGPFILYGIEGQRTAILKYSVNAMLSFCYFTSPNGSIYYSPSYNATQLNSGICTFQTEFVPDFQGEWKCNFGLRGRANEVTYSFLLYVKDSLMSANPPAEISKENNVHISCHIVDRRPLRYCRFIKPSGEKIYFADNLEIMKNYTNFNQEDYGICSIFIKSVTEQDVGKWTCIGKEFDSDAEHFGSVIVEYNNSLSASAIAGIACSVIIIVAIIGIFGWYNQEIKRRYCIPRS